MPRRENGDRHDESRQDNQPEADAIDSHVVVHLEIITDANPLSEFSIMHRSRGLEHIIKSQGEADEEGDNCNKQCEALEQISIALGKCQDN